MRILLCGHRSFAAKGLPQALRDGGHQVICFTRGPVGAADDQVTGPVEALLENPHLAGGFDAVINYIMLKDADVAANAAYIRSLLAFCRDRGVRHLIHISSISSYATSLKRIDEHALLEPDPMRKGPYGAIKAAADHQILKELPADIKLTLVRPGFILGPGLVNPIVGTGVRLPWNRLLVMGNARSPLPLIGRQQVHQAVRLAVETPPDDREVLLLVSPNSPSRAEYLQACCDLLGCGTGVVRLPVPVWYGVAACAQLTASLLGQGKLRPWSKLVARLPKQEFDPALTQKRLGMELTLDWKRLLRESMDGQEPNFDLPPTVGPLPALTAHCVTFLGFGRIVRRKHLPALKRLGCGGPFRAYDLLPGEHEGIRIERIGESRPGDSDLFIVATPGPVHHEAIDLLSDAKGTVLVEKPLACTAENLHRWLAFASSRTDPVLVCHNYRLKDNTQQMLRMLSRHNPGRLLHVHLDFQSPPVADESASWLRDERKARTLLLDYALHFIDLACLFARGDIRADAVRYELNTLGQTSLIEGRLSADNHTVSLLLRQGFAPRRCRLTYSFQNYIVHLGFFPDTFTVQMADVSPWLWQQEKRASRRATLRKVLDRLRNRDSDLSHAAVIAGAMVGSPAVAGLHVQQLATFYRAMFEVERQAYGG